MKKCIRLLALTLAVVCMLALSACGGKESELKKITIGASPAPHAEILALIKDDLKAEGYELVIKEFNDYVLPNTALDAKELDANYFQHLPYLENFNVENGTKLVSVGGIHFEPLGIYAGKSSDLKAVPQGAKIAVPNDTTNEARALMLLESQGIIKLKEGAGLTATKLDIVENPYNVEIEELAAEQIPRVLPDVDFGVINGNVALAAGLEYSAVLVTEDVTTGEMATFANTYVNILVVREGDENREDIQALLKALKSDKVKNYITEHYNGLVIAMF
ncbi:MAG: MetQ/NlpA family ABC transporter substrate-binding protein [Clostridia bacterium]|nr:MetQ/NlpA family ABC transporter substrate-binding protein [Clostridia bacterium]